MNDKPLINIDEVHSYQHEFVSKFSANVLKSTRKLRGISQKKMADKCGYSFQQQQKYEKGINLMRSGNVFLQACYLGIPINLCFPHQIFKSDNPAIYNFIDGRYQYPEINIQSISKYRKIYEISLMLSVIENEMEKIMKNEEIKNLVKNLVKAEIKKLGFDERYISPEELSERWNISVRTLEDWRLKGKPPVFMKIQGSHRAKIAYPLNAEGFGNKNLHFRLSNWLR